MSDKDQGSMTVSGPSTDPGSQSPHGNGGGNGINHGGSGHGSNAVARGVGDALAVAQGLNPADFTGYYLNGDGDVIGVSPLVGGDAFGVNLGSPPTGHSPSGNGPGGQGPSSLKGDSPVVTFKGDVSDARIAALNKIIADNHKLASSGQSGDRPANARRKVREAQAELALIDKVRRKQAADAEAARQQQAEKEAQSAEDAAARQLREADEQLRQATQHEAEAAARQQDAQRALDAASAALPGRQAGYDRAAGAEAQAKAQEQVLSGGAGSPPSTPQYQGWHAAYLKWGAARREMEARKAELDAAGEAKRQAEAALNAANAARAQAGENRQQKEQAKRNAEARVQAEAKARDEKEALMKASGIISDVGEKVSEHAGEKFRKLANDIAGDIRNFQGKTMRSVDQAMDSLNRILANPSLKIKPADTKAIVNAWKTLNAQDMANRLGNLARAFKVADIALKAEAVREKSIVGYETGNWKPLMLEVESWVLAGMSSALALALLAALMGLAPAAGLLAAMIQVIGIITISVLASTIDDKFTDKVNDVIVSLP